MSHMMHVSFRLLTILVNESWSKAKQRKPKPLIEKNDDRESWNRLKWERSTKLTMMTTTNQCSPKMEMKIEFAKVQLRKSAPCAQRTHAVFNSPKMVRISSPSDPYTINIYICDVCVCLLSNFALTLDYALYILSYDMWRKI